VSWAKVDDHANEHHKLLEAGAEACWLWTCGLMYANRQPARDGRIPAAAVAMLYPFKNPKRLAEKLVEVGLWERTETGYQIHEFTFWNQTKEQRETTLAKGRERAARSYENRKPKNVNSSPPSSLDSSGDSSGEEFVKKTNSSGSTPLPLHSAAAEDPAAAATPSLADRARRVLDNPLEGRFEQPSKWPEVVAVAAAMSFGMALRLRDHADGDRDLKAILELFADGYDVEALVQAGTAAKSDPYFERVKKPGPATFTAAVVRRLLADARPVAKAGVPNGSVDVSALGDIRVGAEGL
jgi:hypothetical protein